MVTLLRVVFILFSLGFLVVIKKKAKKKMFPTAAATSEGSSVSGHERNESHPYEGVRKYIYSTPFIVCINYSLWL